ncbi:E3 ubiquitin-protein ligase At3g02290-like [Durio zibethinus]|uniref:RING-type E3 ubiquitin transferase n=1 Tax=Durio zibethinus TaxID=66656 RepID=A0A6P6BFA2_DURZI|nr:E3 ubiquitin-protein ligase At3g02290-like [Durio zibethinus]
MHYCFLAAIFYNASLASWAYKFVQQYTGIKSNEQLDAPASAAQVAAPLNSYAVSNDIQSNIVTSAPRILHFDADVTLSDQHQDGQIKEQENDQVDMEHDCNGIKSTGLQCEARCLESKTKFSSEKPETEVARACGLSEDEDVCPTCLEEYIPENPRIVLQCSHSYHLSCIYEWMERSENCPICGKVIQFLYSSALIPFSLRFKSYFEF